MSEHDYIGYLQKKGLVGRIGGRHFVGTCPYCGKEKHFYFNVTNGLWDCKVCGESGNYYTLRRKFGDVQFLKPFQKEKRYRNLHEEKISFKPVENNAEIFLKRERGLSREVINTFRLGVSEKNGKEFISIPYFSRENKLISVKYRGIEKKEFLREENCKSILFGENLINFDNKDIFITEGEFDCMAGYQLGYRNIVSVPNGANVEDGWVSVFDSFHSVNILFDNDSAGHLASEKLAERIGKTKCIRWHLPLKDLNLCLLAGMSREEIEKNTTRESMSDPCFVHASEFFEEVMERWKNPQLNLGLQTDFSKFNLYLGGIRESEVTILTADTGSGKTTFLMNIVHHLLRQNAGCLVCSTEMSPSNLVAKLWSIHSGKCFFDKSEMTESELSQCAGWFGVKPIYFIPVHGKIEISKIEENIESGVRLQGIKVVVLDHLHYLLDVKKPEEERYAIDQFMRKIVHISKKYKIHIFLIVHPAKFISDKGDVTMNSMKGSSTIKQDADNIILLKRLRDEEDVLTNTFPVEIVIPKVRDDCATGGKIKLNFNPRTQSYMEIS